MMTRVEQQNNRDEKVDLFKNFILSLGRKQCITALILLMSCCPFLHSVAGESVKESVTLVRDSQPVAAVRIANTAPASVRYAAGELVKYVKMATGAELKLNPADFDKFPNKIFLGQAALDANPELSKTPLVEDGVNIVAKDGCLYIFGLDSGKELPFPVKGSHWTNPPKIGTLLSVYAFLRKEVGVRWYLPDELFEEVPQTKTLTAKNGTFTENPWFIQRCLWGQFTKGKESDYDWFYRNGTMPFMRGYHAGHAYAQLLPPKDFMSSDPDIFAMTPSGSRAPTQLCTSNAKTEKLIAEAVRKYFKKNPGSPVCSIGPNDESSLGEYCQCPECLAIDKIDDYPVDTGRVSRRIWEFNNRVARTLAKEYPDKILTCYAYSRHTLTPKNFKVEPNLGVYICLWAGVGTWWNQDAKNANKKMVDEWIAAGAKPDNMEVYEYYGYNPELRPRVNAWEISDELRFLKTHGIRLLMAEFHSTIPQAFDAYAIHQFMRTPDADVNGLLADFCSAFGPGKTEMEKFYRELRRLQSENKDLFKGEGLAELRMCIDAARKAIGDDSSRFAKRLECVQLPLQLMELTAAVGLAHEKWSRQNGMNEESTTTLRKAGKQWKVFYTKLMSGPMARQVNGNIYRLPKYCSMAMDIEGFLARNASGREITVRKTVIMPVIDGSPDDEAWKNAFVVSDFKEYSSRDSGKLTTGVRLLYDDKYLYGLAICGDPDGGHKKDSCRNTDGDTWKENDFELFIQPAIAAEEAQRAPQELFYQITCNSLGTVLDSVLRSEWGAPEKIAVGDISWSSAVEFKTSKSDDRWVAEFRLPFNALGAAAPKAGDIWKGNVARHVSPGDLFLSWYPLLGSPAVRVASLGKIAFVDAPAKENLFRNGSFEDVDKEGFLPNFHPPKTSPSSEHARVGERSMLLETKEAKVDNLIIVPNPRIKIESGAAYNLSFWTYVEGDTKTIGGAGGKQCITVRLVSFDKAGKPNVIKWLFPAGIQEKTWQKLEFDFETPIDAKSLSVEFRSYNIVSKRWFDDVQLVKK